MFQGSEKSIINFGFINLSKINSLSEQSPSRIHTVRQTSRIDRSINQYIVDNRCRSDFKDALYTFRQERQTLAGLNLDRIEESLLDIVRRKYPDEKVDSLTCL